jgi:hypothetical protein
MGTVLVRVATRACCRMLGVSVFACIIVQNIDGNLHRALSDFSRVSEALEIQAVVVKNKGTC